MSLDHMKRENAQ